MKFLNGQIVLLNIKKRLALEVEEDLRVAVAVAHAALVLTVQKDQVLVPPEVQIVPLVPIVKKEQLQLKRDNLQRVAKKMLVSVQNPVQVQPQVLKNLEVKEDLTVKKDQLQQGVQSHLQVVTKMLVSAQNLAQVLLQVPKNLEVKAMVKE